MYWRHFNLTAEPFSLTPDPSFLYLSPVHAEAFAAMTMGLRERRGLITMIGEVGTGKTTLVYSLLSGLGPEIHTAYISNARLSFDGILRLALRDFGVPCASANNADLLDAFNKFLLDCATQGTTAALVIDEAQNLSQETFEDLRLLSNFETYTHKLLQIVLVGQPELDAKLREPSLRQVAERVAVRCVVNPLTRGQSRQYLEHRLAAVNGSLSLFTGPALRLLIGRSRGIPRSLNILAHNAMLFAYGEESSRVVRRFVAAAVSEKEGNTIVRLWRRPKRTQNVGPASPTTRRRNMSSLWALTGAAIAGLAVGFVLAGTDWASKRGGAEQRPWTAEPASPAPIEKTAAVVAPSAEQPVAQAAPEPSVVAADEDVAMIPGVDAPLPPSALPEEHAPVAPAEPVVEVPVVEPQGANAIVPVVAEVVAAPAPVPVVQPIAAAAAPVVVAATEPSAPVPVEAPALSPPVVAAATAPALAAPAAPVAPAIVEPVVAAVAAPALPSVPVIATAPPAAIPPPSSPTPSLPVAAPARTVAKVAPPPVAKAAVVTTRSTRAARRPTTPAVAPVAAPVPAPVKPPVRVAARTQVVEQPAVASPAPQPTAVAAPQDPATVVTVPAGSSLSDLMLSVYGQYNSQMMERVQAVNPQVTDPDVIIAGDRLRFPEKAAPTAIPVPGAEAR